MYIRKPIDPLIDDPLGLKPERIQFTTERPETLAKWIARKTREVMTRSYKIESLAEAAILADVIATHANPHVHHVKATYDQGLFTVEIVPLKSDTAGGPEFELMLALEETWQTFPASI